MKKSSFQKTQPSLKKNNHVKNIVNNLTINHKKNATIKNSNMCCQTLNIFPPSNPAPWCLASSVCKKELNGPVLESACERAQKIRPILQKI